ncbi:MAG: hypothetical protein LC808_39150 [Actinobacteria bacterium]|nr:hypothetical protein [Actinomycetota bacterium]
MKAERGCSRTDRSRRSRVRIWRTGPVSRTTTGVPQEERRPGSRRRNDDRGPAGGTTTGVPQEERRPGSHDAVLGATRQGPFAIRRDKLADRGPDSCADAGANEVSDHGANSCAGKGRGHLNHHFHQVLHELWPVTSPWHIGINRVDNILEDVLELVLISGGPPVGECTRIKRALEVVSR